MGWERASRAASHTASTFRSGRNHGLRRFILALSYVLSDNVGKVKQFLLPSPIHPNLYLFAPMLCWKFSPRNLDFHKPLSSVGGSLRQRSLGTFRPWPRDAGASLLSRAKTKVCMLITQGMGGWDVSQVPYCMVLDPTASTKALLPTDRCQIFVAERGIQWGTSYSAM